MYEKRVYIRVPVGIEGSYQPLTWLAAPRLGMTRDISLGGARFASSDRLEPGGKISLTLSLPKQGEVILTGTVIWSRMTEQDGGQVGYESGLCWLNVDAHAQARLLDRHGSELQALCVGLLLRQWRAAELADDLRERAVTHAL